MHKPQLILSKKILHWYDNNKRILPWRLNLSKRKKEYYTLISEFMLQQTQVKTVIPYFLKFVNRIPNLKVLSKSTENKILKLWEGLGYYRRAKNLHKTAKILVNNYNGKLPKKFKEIKKLPGIGEYTANALLALVYNKPCIPIDGNVKRVFSRLFLIDKNDKNFDKKIIKNANKLINTNRNADLAEGLMEFGAMICKPQNPQCKICNLKNYCKFFNLKTEFLPKKGIPIKEKKFNVYCYLNRKEQKIALTKNNNLGFLKNFVMPKVQMLTSSNNLKVKGWNYLCNYKNNISNIKMDINLFYKFTKKKPEKFKWYSVFQSKKEFVPSFTKKILKKIEKIY